MLHVFCVNEGRMLNLDVSAGIGSVQHLQKVIQEQTHVLPHYQVLLKSGGEALDSNRPISDYEGAWTESNPLFMLCKVATNAQSYPVSCDNEIVAIEDSLNGLIKDVAELDQDSSSAPSASSRAVVDRYAEEARQAASAASVTVAVCARLVQQQHLLHQGWLALVSNLDDSLSQYEKRVRKFRMTQERVQTMRTKAAGLLGDFQPVLEGLAKITVPLSLTKPNAMSVSQTTGFTASSSLLDWISASDPNYSLRDLSEDVQMHLQKISEKEIAEINTILTNVTELGKKSGEREIKGINMRFAQLENEYQKVESLQQTLKEGANVIEQHRKTCDNSTIKEAIQRQRDAMSTFVIKSIGEFLRLLKLFAKSKSEILSIIRKRLCDGWIMQVYEHMHKANNALVLIEEKVVGLRRRLDLIRQLKDAPTVYAAAIAEVLRRSAFRQELRLWADGFHDHWVSFARDETNIRDEFAAKLDKHFLRALFTGMGDHFPSECYDKRLPEFDRHLPPVDLQHLRDLKQAVPSLAGLLKITEPQVHHKLNVEGTLKHPGSLSLRGRDDSVFTDSPHSFGNLHRQFPSTTWLSGDENFDFSSPTCGAAMMLGRTPPSRFASSTSLGPPRGLNPLPDQDEVDSPRTIVAKSTSSTAITATAPIQIPGSPAAANRQAVSFYTGVDVDTVVRRRHSFSSPPDVSEIVKQQSDRSGGTTSGEYQEQFAMDKRLSQDVSHHLDADEREKLTVELADCKEKLSRAKSAVEKLRPLIGELDELKKDLTETRRHLTVDGRQRASEVEAHTALVARSAIALESNLQRDLALAQNAAQALMREEYEQEMQQLRMTIKNEEMKVLQRDKQMGHLNALVDQKDDVITLLEQQMREAIDQLNAKCESLQADTFKNLTIEYELQMDAMRNDQTKAIKSKDHEIAELRRQLTERSIAFDKQKAELETLIATYASSKGRSIVPETGMSASHHSLGSLHQESTADKSKMQLLIKGMEERFAEAMTRCKKEAEVELRMALAKQKDRITDLESQLSEARAIAAGRQSPASATLRDSPIPPAPPSGLTTSISPSMMESAMVIDQSESMMLTGNGNGNEDAGSDITVRMVTNSASTQTRINLKAMRLMIATHDIHEECAVLVVWDDVHNSYVLFSTSSTFYFVKESCIREMGMLNGGGEGQPAGTGTASVRVPRRNWMLATTTKLEFCQIKRLDNRYRLPMDTRFYRVDVKALPLDAATLRRHRSPTLTVEAS